MKIRFTKSLEDKLWDGDSPISKEEYRGMASRIKIGEERTLMIILPCGHLGTLNGWEIENIDTDTPTATPSILCKGNDGKDCWHGWLKNGELVL